MKNTSLTILLLSLWLIHSIALANTDTRSAELQDYDAVRQLVEQYTSSARRADVEGMRPLFHEKAVAIGTVLGRELIATPTVYFDFVLSRPAPQDVGEKMLTSITELRIDGNIARAQVEFANHWCTSGTNHLGLLKNASGEWKIISFMFWVRQPPKDVDVSRFPEGYCTSATPPES